MESISVFDIIKVGIGPSSSHTMGPWKAAEMFLNAYEADLKDANSITIYLYGSLAKTGKGHGTDIAILMGLSGEDYTQIDPLSINEKVAQIRDNKIIKLKGLYAIAFDEEVHLHFLKKESLAFHPNGLRFVLEKKQGEKIEKDYFSVGGGFVVSDTKKTNQVALTTPYPCHKAEDIVKNCQNLNIDIAQLVYINEQAWRTPVEIEKQVNFIWNEIKACVYRGVNRQGILPGGLNVRRRAFELNENLLQGKKAANFDEWVECIKQGKQDFNTVNKWISTFAIAVNEENAALGRIVTAPTNGASGVIPAVMLYAYCFLPNFNQQSIKNFLLIAGEIGTLYKKKATISAAMGGCQAEIGVSSSMAAGALAYTMGANTKQVLQAAEIAMEHHLGMTCDPIGGLVQIPCIERNSMGAVKAITAANIAVEDATDLSKISLDDVIASMWETAQDMHHKYKETSEGGLANISVNIPEC